MGNITEANNTTIKKVNNKSSFARFFYHLNKNKTMLLLTMPMVILVFIFCYIPMFGIIIAFKHFRYDLGFFGSHWSGFENFKFFFASPDALSITVKTLGYNGVFIILDIVVSVGVAILLYEINNRKLLKIYQTTMFLPYFLSWVVVAYMAYAFLNPASGMLNSLLVQLGGEKIDWYTKPFYWIFILPIAHIWKSLGFGALVYYASLMSIDSEYFEAAAIEGASKWQIIRKITLPFLYPLMIILTILAIGRIFNADFGLFFQLPMDSKLLYKTTDVIETYIYRALAVSGNIDMASAAGLLKSIVGFVLVIVTNEVVKKINPENSLY